MDGKDIFQEVISKRLSPVLMTGSSGELWASLREYVEESISQDQQLVVDRLDSTGAQKILDVLRLRLQDFTVLVDARKATSRAWDRLLKELELPRDGLTILLVADEAPAAVVGRCFRVHLPKKGSLGGLEGPGSFAVGSWLTSVDDRHRDQLLKTCQSWTAEHTDLLIAEISSRLEGNSTLDLTLQRTTPSDFMSALTLLSKYRESPVAPAYVGLRLMR